jgi:hypothetical protein
MLNVGTEGHPKKVWMELIASSGTAYLEYEAYNNTDLDNPDPQPVKLKPELAQDQTMPYSVKLDVTQLGSEAKLFFPYTTTLIEITLEREPTPLADVSGLFGFLGRGSGNR